MYARELMVWLHERLASSENFEQTIRRFDSLRGHGLLPRGRENAGVRLSDDQIASAVLGFGHSVPGYAGQAALILGDLRSVGGDAASFHKKSRLQDVISELISDELHSANLQRITLIVSRSFGDDEYEAKIRHLYEGASDVITYVSKYAYSVLEPGAEEKYNHDFLNGICAFELSLGSKFFVSLSQAVLISRQLGRPFETDWREFETEEERAEFNRKLGAHSSSNFLNLRVDSQVVWPREPMRIKFGKYNLVLFPKTKEYSHSISIDLRREGLSAEEARSLINHMLSVMSWCDDRPASVHDGWSGSSVPQQVLKRNLAFVTTPVWCFARVPVNDELLRKCLAYYRDGLNALSVGLASHAVLSFYRVIETKNDTKARMTKWINDHIGEVKSRVISGYDLYEADRKTLELDDGKYIYKWCRVATAHAARDAPSDPDTTEETRRLLNASGVIRCLARIFISTEFNYSDKYSGCD